MTRPPDIGVRAFVLGVLLFSSINVLASAQQQRLPQVSGPHTALRRSTWVDVDPQAGISLEKASGKLQRKNSKNDDATPLTDVRALATLAPSGRLTHTGDVRAPPARSTGPTGGLSSRPPARSLQDWEVEDFVLLATVDGTIHARDREKGTARWALQSERPMVETVYHDRNTSEKTTGDGHTSTRDFYWIVEPSQDGSLYGYTPGSPFGMQRLGLTVKQLVEDLSPYAAEDPPVVYTAEKKNTLYTVDAATGRVLKTFSAGTYYSANDPGVCRQVGGLPQLDDDECGATGTLTLGRTEYTVGIQSSVTGEPICTIRYFEWGPNNRDKDLQNQYSSTKDNRYIYSLYDGRVMALDHFGDKPAQNDFARNLKYNHKFESPVVRVFDVARPIHSRTLDTPLVILPQPIGPSYSDDSFLNDDSRVFVNCTEGGSWYALSETEYPMVTDGALPAQCSRDDWIYTLPLLPGSAEDQLKKALVGVHALSYEESLPIEIPTISGSDTDTEIAPHNPASILPDAAVGLDLANVGKYEGFLPTLVVMILLGCFAFLGFRRKGHTPASFTAIDSLFETTTSQTHADQLPNSPAIPSVTSELISDEVQQAPPENITRTVRFEDNVQVNEAVVGLEAKDVVTVPDPGLQAFKAGLDDADGGEATNKKKKAHRGQRGGKRLAEKRKAKLEADEADAIVEGVKQMGQDVTVTPDAITTTSDSASDGPIGLQNLTFSTDKVLGTGSGGTIVYEGKFEGRDVAVKRMLTVHYELASQEVSLLEQNEEHPNVIRYFCRREDRHFLYIALELCQASVFDLFKDSRIDSNATPDPKHATLATEISRSPVQALKQLAEGIKHLHALRIVHRDIKPQNMLIAYPKKNSVNTFPRLIISDFGLCKTLPEGASTLVGATVNAGTTGWKAPELISQPRDASAANGSHTSVSNSSSPDSTHPGAPGVKRAVDIFSLGCVFYYVLTRGLHPFDDDEGWPALRERNIKTNRLRLSAIELHGPDTVDLIRWMLAPRPEDRPTAAEVLAHPFFWTPRDRLEFLSQASDRFDLEPRDGSSAELAELESRADGIIGPGPTTLSISSSPKAQPWAFAQHARSASSAATGTPLPLPGPNFLAKLDRKFIDALGKQRKYDGGRLADLLRALRNKYNHYDDMPEDVKARVGEVPDGYLGYWEGRFPGLVVGVWRAVRAVGLGGERRFDRWFAERGG